MIPMQALQGMQQPQRQIPQQPLQGMQQIPSQAPQMRIQKLELMRDQIEKKLVNESLSPQEFKQVYQVKLAIDTEIEVLSQSRLPQQGMVQDLQQPMIMPQMRQKGKMPFSQPLQRIERPPNAGFINQALRPLDPAGMVRGR